MSQPATAALLTSLPRRVAEAPTLQRALRIVALRAPFHRLLDVMGQPGGHNDLVIQLTSGADLFLVIGGGAKGEVIDALLLRRRPVASELERLRSGESVEGLLGLARSGDTPSDAAALATPLSPGPHPCPAWRGPV